MKALSYIATTLILMGGLASRSALAQTSGTSSTAAITAITLTSSTHQFLADRSGTVTITVSVSYRGTLSRLGARLMAPESSGPKWSFVSATGASAKPLPGDTSAWEFSFTNTPASPVTFNVTLNYASGLASVDDAIVALQTFTAFALQDTPNALDSRGAPISATLTLAEATFHAADVNRDTRIELLEVLKVVQIYNARNGTVRTGAYDATFEPAPNTTPVVPVRPHSADLDRDGTISLLELMRVMDLAKYVAPSGRTGEYHADSRGVDGFLTGP